MNQDHAVAGTAGASTTAMLATVLAHFQGIDPNVAAAEAGLIVLALGALYAIGQTIVARFFTKEK